MADAGKADFRLPGDAVRRAFFQHATIIVLVLVLYHLLARQSSLEVLVGAAALAAGVLAIGYAATARRIWVTVSRDGLSSTASTGRRLDLPWSVPVRIAASRRSGQKGHAVSALQHGGLFGSRLHAVFIPAAISASPEFAGSIAAWAPAGHPLRSIASGDDQAHRWMER